MRPHWRFDTAIAGHKKRDSQPYQKASANWQFCQISACKRAIWGVEMGSRRECRGPARRRASQKRCLPGALFASSWPPPPDLYVPRGGQHGCTIHIFARNRMLPAPRRGQVVDGVSHGDWQAVFYAAGENAFKLGSIHHRPRHGSRADRKSG
jgi:hypothetical protein